jgi:hypothetical protein
VKELVILLLLTLAPASFFRLWWVWWTTSTCPKCGEAPRDCEGHPAEPGEW